MNKKTVLTFVGKSFAKKGFRFYYQGKNQGCTTDCRLYQTCQGNLESGNVYEIIEIIKSHTIEPKTHECAKGYHEEEMVLVRVQIPETFVSMRNKDIYEGSVVQYTPMVCDAQDCPNYGICVPEIMVRAGEKIVVKEKLDRINNCVKGESISKVRIEKKKD